jgi:tyrosine-protein phosphatase YwqE
LKVLFDPREREREMENGKFRREVLLQLQVEGFFPIGAERERERERRDEMRIIN